MGAVCNFCLFLSPIYVEGRENQPLCSIRYYACATDSSKNSTMTVLSFRARGGPSPNAGTRPLGETASSSGGLRYGSTSSAEVEIQTGSNVGLMRPKTHNTADINTSAPIACNQACCTVYAHLVINPEIFKSYPSTLDERTETARKQVVWSIRCMCFGCFESVACALGVVDFSGVRHG